MKYLPEFTQIENVLNSKSKNWDKFKNKIVLVKFGGSAANGNENNDTIFIDLCYLKWIGVIPVLVHGGGPIINNLLDLAGVKSKFVDGQRITDNNTIDYVEMALKGKANNHIIKKFNRLGFKSIGISGCDGFMVKAKKRKAFLQSDGSKQSIDMGLVGDVEEINTDLLNLLISNDYIPVIAPLGFGNDYNTYNINADIFAGSIAASLKADYYISITDVDGLRENFEDEHSLISEITLDQLSDNLEKTIDGGMIPKIESCITALKNGVNEAYIVNGKRKNILIKSLLSGNSVRTKITK
jgi:acetylglutamate kinase